MNEGKTLVNDMSQGPVLKSLIRFAIPMMLANMLHVSRSSLNQELKLMEKEGYFRIRGHEMQDWDKKKLEELV